MLAGMAVGLGTMFAPELNLPGRPPSGHHPPSARVPSNQDAHRRPEFRLPEQLRDSVAP
jgi:hypothetical protein